MKQSSHNFNMLANDFIIKQGFTRLITDPCYYVRWSGGEFTQCIMFVDDFRIASTSTTLLKDFSSAFQKKFPSTKQATDWYLGMTIVHDRIVGTMHITQESYIDNMLKRFGMQDCKPVFIPAQTTTKLSRDNIYLSAANKDFPMA